MSDLRAFRDAMALVKKGEAGWSVIELDGFASHFKHDLNMDGCVEGYRVDPPHVSQQEQESCADAPSEALYPRFDLNGDGRLNGPEVNPPADAVAPYGAPSDTVCTQLSLVKGCRRDFDVLAFPNAAAWDLDDENVSNVLQLDPLGGEPCPAQGWTSTSLRADRDADGFIDYLRSADFHIESDGLMEVSAGPQFYKCNWSLWSGVLTAPILSGQGIRIEFGANRDAENRNFALVVRARIGEDFELRTGFDEIELRSTSREKNQEVLVRAEQWMEWTTASWNPFRTATGPSEAAVRASLHAWAEQHLAPVSVLANWLGSAQVKEITAAITCIEANQNGDCIQYEGTLTGVELTG